VSRTWTIVQVRCYAVGMHESLEGQAMEHGPLPCGSASCSAI
jgi:hypothetical protein